MGASCFKPSVPEEYGSVYYAGPPPGGDQFRNGHHHANAREGPSKGPSTEDMWSDPYPPTFHPDDWYEVRDGLHKKGLFLKSLGGNAQHVGEKTYRASLALNLMQEDYKTRLSTVGNQSGLLLERALGVFLNNQEDYKEDDTPNNKIKLMQKQNLESHEVVAACHKLREYRNRADHDHLQDLSPFEKPDILQNAFIVAQALLRRVEQARMGQSGKERGNRRGRR